MKTFKTICTAAILALALSVPASAGDVYTPGYTEPPPPPPPVNMTVETNMPTATSSDLGDINTPDFADILWVLVATIF